MHGKYRTGTAPGRVHMCTNMQQGWPAGGNCFVINELEDSNLNIRTKRVTKKSIYELYVLRWDGFLNDKLLNGRFLVQS